MGQKAQKHQMNREVMWLTIYLRMAGVEPLPFRHRTHRLYAADLQRQLSTIERRLGGEKLDELRRQARELVRASSLHSVSTGNRPAESNGKTCQQKPTQGSRAVSSEFVRFEPTASQRWNCRRKLKHINYLSALHHARHLGDPDLLIYPCPICLGLHVGHDPIATRLKAVRLNLAAIESRLAELEVERRELDRRRAALLEQRQRLREKRTVVEASIEEQLDSPGGH